MTIDQFTDLPIDQLSRGRIYSTRNGFDKSNPYAYIDRRDACPTVLYKLLRAYGNTPLLLFSNLKLATRNLSLITHYLSPITHYLLSVYFSSLQVDFVFNFEF